MELLEKAKRDYPIGTKFKSLYKDVSYIVSKPIFSSYGNIYTYGNGGVRCIYDFSDNLWAEIIKEDTMTQQEFNSLRVGEFISQYEILHKYKEFLIVRCEDGHDLFDLAKINKLGLKVTPKTFMGLEIDEYDNVPCEVDGCLLVYLTEVKDNCILYKPSRNSKPDKITPDYSIRIL